MSEARTARYLDFNAAAPLRPEAVEALSSLLEISKLSGLNPSSIHSHGQRAKRLLSQARDSVAGSLGSNIDPEELVFTGSGSEANQLAIRSVLEPLFRASLRPHWILSAVEHDSVRQLVAWVTEWGGSVTELPVDGEGRPRVDELASLIRPETALISLVWVNNETGVVADVAAAANAASSPQIPLHVDAAQAWGKLPIDVRALGASFVAFSGHKIGAPAGTGVLWVRPGNRVSPVLLGKQEKGRRGGTENLMGIVGLGAAAACVKGDGAKLEPLRDWLEAKILARIPGTRVNGQGATRVGNTSNFTFDGLEGEGLVIALDLAGYSVSAGSACSSGALEPSHVLLALGRTRAEAMSSIRVSIGPETTREVLEGFAEVLESTVTRLRAARVRAMQTDVGGETNKKAWA